MALSVLFGACALVLVLVVDELVLGGPAHPPPVAVSLGLGAVVLLSVLVPVGVAVRYSIAASRVRARVNTGTPGVGGFVARHGLAMGFAIGILMAVVYVALRLVTHSV
jgi:hypothetical protein